MGMGLQEDVMLLSTLDEVPARLATGHAEFVPAAFACDREQAHRLIELLERHQVPGILDDAGCSAALGGLGRGIPVLVPAQMHDSATEILAEDDEEDDDLYDDDDDFEDDDLDDLDDLDDDFDEEEDDDFDPEVADDDDLD